jgi:hypothetical protein
VLADFEDSPATYRFLTDCTTLDRHRAFKAIMAKTLYGTVAILPAAVAQITREDMLQYLTMTQLVFTVGSTGRALLGRLLGPMFGRLRPTPVLPWSTTAAAYRRVFGLVSAPATHCGAGRSGLHGPAAGICRLCDGLCNPPGSVPSL